MIFESAKELFDYLCLQRALNENYECEVECDKKFYLIESTRKQKVFQVSQVSHYTGKVKSSRSSYEWFPFLTFPLKRL